MNKTEEGQEEEEEEEQGIGYNSYANVTNDTKNNSLNNKKMTNFQSNDMGLSVLSGIDVPRCIGMYDVGRTLGEGRFATVKFGRHKQTGAFVAIKIILKDNMASSHKMVMREICSMKLLKHPHVVRILEVLASKSHVYIVLEYMDGGELFDKILDLDKLDEIEARKYFQQLIRGLDYCHSRGVYHRDLKPENLLLDENNNLKISDFGLSALAKHRRDDGLFHTVCGSRHYIAPEVTDDEGYEGAPADLWSCGMILYVLLAGSLPFYESNIFNHAYRKVKQLELEFTSDFPTGPQQLIRRLLDPNPRTRLTIDEIYKNEWFQAGSHCFGAENPLGHDICFGNGHAVSKAGKDSGPAFMNAFEIICMLSKGLDLSGLFTGYETLKKQTKFASTRPAREIIKRMESFAIQLGYQVISKNFKMKMQSSKPGRKGFLCVVTEVREVAPCLFMVDLHKTNGDTLEYCDFQRRLYSGLGDIVWKSEEDIMGYC